MWDGVFGEPVCFLLSRGGGTIVQRGEGASFGPREWGLTTMDRTMGVGHMKRILMMLSLCVTVMSMGMGVAQGATSGAQQECEAQAAVKKLAGAAKTSFVGKCVKDASANGKAAQCEKAAADKKLAGAAKNSFIQKCVKTDGAADKAAQCEKAAADKKLAGAAKNSFVQKCVKTT